MEIEGVRKGDFIHAYIDVEDKEWGNRGKDETILLLNQLASETRLKGDGEAIIPILPAEFPLRISNGLHRLHAYCMYLVSHWDSISNVRKPLDPPPTGCRFAEGLSKTPAEILAQDEAFWLVNIEYVRK
jgi:hypothetical protein